MKRSLTLILMAILLPIAMMSQGVYHRKLRHTGFGECTGEIQTTSAGESLIPTRIGAGIWGIMKVDALGNVLWTKDYNFATARFRAKPNGEMIACGNLTLANLSSTGSVLWSRSLSQEPYAVDVAPNGDIYLLTTTGVAKCNSLGNVVWTRTVSSDLYLGIEASGGGGCYLFGLSDPGTGYTTCGTVIRLNDDGSLAWARKSANTELGFEGLVETADQQLILTGTDHLSTPATTEYMRLDGSGNLLWNMSSELLYTRALTATADSGAAGISMHKVSGGIDPKYDFCMVQVSKSGGLQWAKDMEFGGMGTTMGGAGTIVETSDGALAYTYYRFEGPGNTRNQAWYGKLRFDYPFTSCKSNGPGTSVTHTNTLNAWNPTLGTFAFTSTTGAATATSSSYIDSLVCSNCETMPSASFTVSYLPNNVVQFTNTSTSAVSHIWYFGDGTTSTTPNPQHTYPSAGNYTVRLYASSSCATVEHAQIVTPYCNTRATATLDNALLSHVGVCSPGPVTITPTGSYTQFLWNDGSTGNTLTVSAPATFWVNAQSTVNGCYYTDTANATVTGPAANLGLDRVVCPGTAVTLNPGGGFSNYAWSNGATSPTINVTAPGTYSVSVTATNGCTSNDAMLLGNYANPVPMVTASGPTTFCAGGSVMLSAPNFMTAYAWSNGVTTPSIYVSTSGSYTVTVTTPNGCVNTSLPTTVTVNPAPSVNITATNGGVSCFGTAVTLTATAGYTSYQWNTGATTPNISVTTAGTYTVTVTNGYGCPATASYTVTSVTSCAIPSGQNTTNITSTSAKVNWTAIPCGNNYQVQYRRTGTTFWTTVTTTSTFYNITGLLASTNYQWRMRATCTGQGTWTPYTTMFYFTTATAKWDGATPSAAIEPMVFPNPNDGNFTLKLHAAAAGEVEMEVYDMLGKNVLAGVWQLEPGENLVPLRLEAGAKGVYELRLQQQGEVQRIRFVVR